MTALQDIILATRVRRTGSSRMPAVLLLIGAAFALALSIVQGTRRATTINWTVSGKTASWEPPTLTFTTVTADILGALVIALALMLFWGKALSTRVRRAMYILAACLLVLSFLILAGAGQSVSLLAFANDSVGRSAPLVLAALGGILCERAGVVNVAIEGQLLLSAFVATIVGSSSGSPWLGVLVGTISAVVVGGILATLSIRFLADQLIIGIVLDVAASGMTAFFVSGLFVTSPAINQTPIVPNWNFGPLSQLPLVGPLLFSTSPFTWIAIVLAAAIAYILQFTRLGLHISAVGENPRAADAAGLNVARIRFLAVLAGAVVIGIGGAYFSVGSVGSFSPDMTGGRGFIALAAVILGNWNPRGAIAAAFLFGTADAFQSLLSLLGIPVSSALLLTLPYLVTIVALVMMRGRIHAPTADGIPYQRS